MSIVSHFAGSVEGSLKFSQSALSKKLKAQKKVEQQATEFSDSLSAKCPHIVTWPDVDKALFLWFSDQELKENEVTRLMLEEKQSQFEKVFNVQNEKWMKSNGWIASFKNAYISQAYDLYLC